MRAHGPRRLKRWFLSAGVSAGLLWGALLLTMRAAPQEEPHLRVDVGLVNVTFSVRHPDGTFVPGLTKDDFEVLEDGVPQTIRFFGTRYDLPLSVGLVEDFSPSQDRFNRNHRRDTQAFLKQVLGEKDNAFLVCFGDNIRLVSDLTNDMPAIDQAMLDYDRHPKRFPTLGPPTDRFGGTALFDAIFFSARLKMKPLSGRKALLVFSDGEDNSSDLSLSTAIEAAQGADALVYGIRYTEVKHHKLSKENVKGMTAMKRLSTETGGVDFDANETEMSAVFNQIGQELRSLYELAYTSTDPARDGRFRKIEIRARQGGLKVRARAGYFSQ